MLRLEISMKPNKQHQNRYPDERCAERLAKVSELVDVVGLRVDGDV